jgi:hypothetical protein
MFPALASETVQIRASQLPSQHFDITFSLVEEDDNRAIIESNG